MKLDINTDPADRKSEIDSKLQAELNKLEIIKQNVQRSNQITNGMVSILNSFESRLSRLEETILPVYNETGNLQRRQQNIEKTLTALDHVISYYGVAEEVEDIVKAGPAASSLDEYISVMNKLKNALTYFEKNNPQSVELENVLSLFTVGSDTLCREFKELLLKFSRSIPPIALMDWVATEEEASGDDASVGSGPAVGGFPEAVGGQLSQMATWLLDQGRDEVLNVYAKVRASVVLKSITQLKEQQRSGSGGSTTGLILPAPSSTPSSTPSPSPASQAHRTKYQNRDTPGRRASKRIQAVFEKKANKMLLKASQTLESSTGLSLPGRRSGIHLEGREDIVDEQEVDSYLVCVVAVLRVMSMERGLMAGIVPPAHQNHVFQTIVQQALDVIVQDGENIATRGKRCISRHDFSSAMIIFPILRHLNLLKPDFDRAVEGCDYTVRSQFASIISVLQQTGAKALEEVVESLRSEGGSGGGSSVGGGGGGGLPKDGTVHELTSNCLVLLSQLSSDNADTIASVLASETTVPASSLPPGVPRNQALLGLYVKKVLSQLNCTLVSKSESYTEPGVRAIFRLNNCHHVLKSLQRSNLLALLEAVEPDCQATYLDMIQQHKKAYQTSWNKVLNHISSGEDFPVTPGKMKDKDRSSVKERFAGFNREMEEAAKTQRGYSVPDVELRESLKRDNKEHVLPKYNAFYDKYSSVPFTKNPEKYVKYSPDQVASMIDRFFDVAA